MSKHKFLKHFGGWNKPTSDERDFKFFIPVSTPPLPEVDLRPGMPPVYDQGQLGSCTANAIGAAFEFELLRQKLTDFTPSRLFIYYNERVIEGDVAEDSGAQGRDGLKVIANQGVCPETMWPYDISQFTTKPPDTCYQVAKNNVAIQYLSVPQDLNQMKACHGQGFPFVFGMNVYESFESEAVATTGIVPMPMPGENLLGGHYVCSAGHSDAKQALLVRNSWGSGWGLGGYFWLPYAYIVPETSDYWTIRKVD